MKRFAIVLVIAIAFVLGRFSFSKQYGLPSVPVAFLQMTQPIVVTIQVELDSKPKPVHGSSIAYDLRGTVEYRFTNITGEPISVAFPPVRTISITSNQVSREDFPCPPALTQQQIIEIPSHKYVTFTGDWTCAVTVTGDIDTALKPSAGWHGFAFRPPADRIGDTDFCNETVIAYQTFNYKGQPTYWPTIDDHLRLVSGDTQLTRHEQGGITKP